MINTAIDLVKARRKQLSVCFTQNRSAGTDPAIYVITPDGVAITNSLDASRAYLGNLTAVDLLRNTTALDISPDGKTLALLRGGQFGSVLLVPLTNGLFTRGKSSSFPIGAGATNDNNRISSHDLAGNLLHHKYPK